MAYNESAYPNLLFGVSQQAPEARLPGQLEEQINMTSDLVAGLRRRASVGMIADLGAYTTIGQVRQYNTDMGGVAVSVIVDSGGDGTLKVVEENSGTVLGTFTHAYLKSAIARNLRLVTLNDAVFICNVGEKVTMDDAPEKATMPNPELRGYAYVVTGAFAKAYTLTVTNQVTGTAYDVTFTTPDGSVAGQSSQATPDYIMTQLVSLWASTHAATGVTLTGVGAYGRLVAPDTGWKLTVSTVSGSNYMRTSNASSIRDAAELPARLPADMNGYIIGVGASNVKTFYRYDDARKVWTEDCNWSDMKRLGNMPLRLVRNPADGTYTLDQPTYERRAAGDAKSNPFLKFATDGITGMAAFQGRLVFLSNEYACMSASDNPLRWFRSTLAAVADNDPIEVAAQGSLTAPYEFAVNFNKDLVMFSRRYQGIVPGNTLVTPRTANVALMTRYEVDTTAEPTAAGRSIFFGAPRSLGFVGAHEMVPSQYADSQYVADDVTSHIPRYVKGPFRFMVSSTTSNIMVCGTGEPNELLVHEYLWSAAEKVHSSWHKWVFAHPVVDAYFSGDVLVTLFGVGGKLIICRLDLQRGAGDISPTVPRLDYYVEATCHTPGVIVVPAALGTIGTDIRAFKTHGQNAYLGQKVFTSTPAGPLLNLDVPEAEVGDQYVIGFMFTSVAEPTSPVIKDAKDVPITTSRAVLHKYRVSVANTGEFTYTVGDRVRQTADTNTTPLRLYSQQLGAGKPLADTETVVIPARVDMRTAKLRLSTSDYYDMNVRNIEYGFRFHQRFRRA
jgi:hypothetical protein